MQYRRFGKTNKALSVITLGGMRYHDGWSQPRDQPHREMIEHCCRTVLRALEEGINHIETAYGYGKSEHCYGIALNEELKLPRQSYFLMTKGSPMTADETHRLIEEQLRALRTDHIDLYGWHGVNNAERCRPPSPRAARWKCAAGQGLGDRHSDGAGTEHDMVEGSIMPPGRGRG